MPLKTYMAAAVFAYGGALVLAFLFQRHLTYFPDTSPFIPAEWSMPELETLDVKAADGLNLRSWYRAPRKGKPVMVFFEGNGAHPGYRNFKVRPWLDAGYGLLFVGYRGYGGNPGKPSEQGIYNDSRAAIDAVLKRGIPQESLVFYGESIGAAMAVQMATEYKPAAMILEAPFTSLADVGVHHYWWLPVRLLARDKYDSISKIKNVHVPLLLIHGEKDRIVPVRFGRRLFAAANEPKQAVYIPEAGHNDLYEWGAAETVGRFLRELTKENGKND